MKVMWTFGEKTGEIEDLVPEAARRQLVIQHARVPTAEELAAHEAAASKKKTAKGSRKKAAED